MSTLDHSPWIEMLEQYNYTLRTFQEGSNVGPWPERSVQCPRIDACLRRNKRIGKGLARLHGYHVSPPALLPTVLEMVRSLPTLIYRFVRRGDTNALSDLLLARRKQQQRGGNTTTTATTGLPAAPPPRPRRSARDKWPRA
jgi:hypothetical protein